MPRKLTGGTVVTNGTNAMSISKAHAVADFNSVDTRAECFYNDDTFMAKNLTRFQVMLICSTKPRVCRFNEDFVELKRACHFVGDDLAL